MSTATHTVARTPSVSSATGRRVEAAASVVWQPQRRAQSGFRAPVAVPTSDPGLPDAVPAHPDVLLVRLSELAPGDARRAAVRARAIEWHLPIAVYLARRYAGRGEPLADLAQVAVIGLIKAVDRYDVNRGVAFASYATPTILGEIKRYFRDTVWNVRVPRRLQELKLQLTPLIDDLTQVLQRSPTTAELAAEMGVSRADVLAAWQCATAYQPLSFERSAAGSEVMHLIDSLGGPDPEIETVDTREALRRRLAALPERERRIIGLRYVAEMTQTEIAANLGMSQMQVSRLLARSLTRLRDGLLADFDVIKVPRTGRQRGA